MTLNAKRSFLHPQFTPSDVSNQLVYSGGRLDRLAEEREESCLDEALDHPDALVMGFARGRVVLSFNGSNPNAPQALFPMAALEQFTPKLEQTVLLGYEQGAPRLCVPLTLNPDAEEFSLPEPWKAIDYRSLALQGLLDAETFGILAHGGALLAWHATHRFCAKCGGPTSPMIGGAKRACTQCEKEHFPRTDPVVIMLTTKDDKCLLGRSPHFPPGMYSALAGFVEPGETLENAVRRETFEESGIRVGNVHYHASQPWPFPHTLMIGCYGEALDETIDMDTLELDDCRWFSKQEIRAILQGEGPVNEDGSPQYFTPPKMAIANRLVSDWAAQD